MNAILEEYMIYQNDLFNKQKKEQNYFSVMKVRFEEMCQKTDLELFYGFDDLKVITYSYGLGQISKIMQMFKTGEVIIGCEGLVSEKLADCMLVKNYEQKVVNIITEQNKITNKLSKIDYLKERIINGDFSFFVAHDIISHQKIYLLKSDDGRYRTILGSANFSESAWNGNQIESYTFCDDEKCYSAYMDCFETLKEFSSDKIEKDCLFIDKDEDSLLKIPFLRNRDKNVIVLNTSEKEDVEYTFDASIDEDLKKEIADSVKKAKLVSDLDGKILITAEKQKTITASLRKLVSEEQNRKKMFPQFCIDYAAKNFSFNGKQFDLNVEKNDVNQVLEDFMKYFQGFENFTNDTVSMKRKYFKVLNYMFVSPFFARLRYTAKKTNHSTFVFPIYLMIFGNSDAGKTTFVKTIQKMMFNEEIEKLEQSQLPPP